MEAVRRVSVLVAAPLVAASLLIAPAHAETDPVGGPRLATDGYVWDHTKDVHAPPHIQASSYVIADADTGAVLAAKDPHGHYRPASTLKLLTSVTLIPRLDPNAKVEPSSTAVNVEGSKVGLHTDWTYTVEELFYGLLMQSGNDAAIALAEANGGVKHTVAQMNAEAHRLRANDTAARTTNGLDDDPPLSLKQQHTSAYDEALILRQAFTLPDFRKYTSRVLYKFPGPPTKKQRKKGKKTGGWKIGNHNHLLRPGSEHYPGMIGGKNGWTSHAKGSFAGAATRHGHTIIITLMHAQSNFWGDAADLLDWGFAARGKVEPVGELAAPIPAKTASPTTAAPQAAGDHDEATKPAGSFTRSTPLWLIIVICGALVVLAVGLAAAVRRRRRPATATDSAMPPDHDASPTDTPRGSFEPPPPDGPG